MIEQPVILKERVDRNRLAEAFIRGIEVGAEYQDLAGDGDAMYDEFRKWAGTSENFERKL